MLYMIIAASGATSMQTETFFGERVGDRPFSAVYRVESIGYGLCKLRDLNDRPYVIKVGTTVVYYPRSVMYLDGI